MSGSTLNIVPTNSASVFEVLKKLSTSQQQIALIRPNNPPPGIAGFLFDIVGDEAVELQTDTSDHYLEDNTTVTDQAALRPERVMVRGLVAELVFSPPPADKVAPVANSLPDNTAFSPVLSPGAAQTLAQSEETNAREENSVESGQSLYGTYQRLSSSRPNATRQEQVFGYIYQLWKGRQLFTVETPWGVFTEMILELGRMEQSEESKWTSDSTLTFKKIRTARPVSVNVGQIAGRASFQRAPVSQIGTAGTPTASQQEVQSLLLQMAPKFLIPKP